MLRPSMHLQWRQELSAFRCSGSLLLSQLMLLCFSTAGSTDQTSSAVQRWSCGRTGRRCLGASCGTTLFLFGLEQFQYLAQNLSQQWTCIEPFCVRMAVGPVDHVEGFV